ncbi:MAG: hypothetical protein ACOZBZ_03605 [Patescibacteria group bacterium]
MKKLLTILLILSFSRFAQPAWASPNNKFGIHITQAEDLPLAAELVNSSSGDWGYVTVVIQEDDRNQEKGSGKNQRRRQLSKWRIF